MTTRKGNYATVLKKVQRETPLRLTKALQATAIEGINRLIDRTPVDTGAAKYHWFVRPLPDEKFDKDRTDPSGAQPKAGAKRDSQTVQDRADSLACELGAILYLSRARIKQAGTERGCRHHARGDASCCGRRICRQHFRRTSDHRELRNRYIHG